MSSDQRADRLRKLFRKTISGEQQVKSSQTAKLFLEAPCLQQPPSLCIETVVSGKGGLDAIRDSIRLDLSSPFILSSTLPFLQYLSDPGIKALVDGQLLRKVLLIVATPPTVWNAIVQLLHAHQIPEDQLLPFGWLACELVSLPPTFDIDVVQDVTKIVSVKIFLKAQHYETRELGYKIEKVLQIRCSPQQSVKGDGPGGRHDNDFEDYRRIRIYPTTDEFLSTQKPFFLTAKEVQDAELETRPSVHLANQFRLLREDMVAELREDHQVAIGSKKGRRSTSLRLGHLKPAGLGFGDEEAGRFKRCTLLLHCLHGLDVLQKNAS